MNLEEHIQYIIGVAKANFALDSASIHGIKHWEEVEKNGIILASQTGADLTVIRLFAYLHDCERENDLEDPDHGIRAAHFVKTLRDNGHLNFIDEGQFAMLHTACYWHNSGSIGNGPTIGACFDADRLELNRVGITPLPEFMSTPLGKRIAEKMQQVKPSNRRAGQ
jgi:uncharacterized protein